MSDRVNATRVFHPVCRRLVDIMRYYDLPLVASTFVSYNIKSMIYECAEASAVFLIFSSIDTMQQRKLSSSALSKRITPLGVVGLSR